MSKFFYFFNQNIFFALSLIISLLITGAIYAQGSGGVKGIVSDKNTKGALFGANIVVKGTSLGAAADFDGNYVIRNIPAGEQELVISYVGYAAITVNVNIQNNKILERNFSLEPVGVNGKTVIITAQAKGQLSAINQQLSSNSIVNVVSAEKMQELPDANIAESIGRLPGISLVRNAGEAYAVSIRGLSPQYNEVTIEGIPMSSTNYYDRSVDLSLLSDNMVQGVEVSKTLQPDMDANALGGTINITLRNAQPGFHYNIWGNGAYTDLRNSYNNYKFSGSVSNRFFGDKIGVLVQGNIEEKQLPSDQFNAGYAIPIYSSTTNQFSVSTQQAELTESTTQRHRYGASLILDYASNLVDIKFYNIFDQISDSNLVRDNTTYFVSPGFYDQIYHNQTNTIQETHSLQALFKFGGTELPVSLSYTKGQYTVPNGQQFVFYQTNVPALSASSLVYGQPTNLINAMGVLDPNNVNTTLYNILQNSTNLRDEQYDGKIDWKVPFKLSDYFSGTLSVGGKYHEMTRTSKNTQYYYNLLFGGSILRRENLINAFPFLKGANPNLSAGIPANYFTDPSYTRKSILGYPIGPGFDVNKLSQIMNVIYPGWLPIFYYDGVNSFNQNYDDNEKSEAGYAMGEFNLGSFLTFVLGARYQEEMTDISAYHVEANGSNQNGLTGPPVFVNSKRDYTDWYPSINIKYKATNHLQLLGAIYKSETLPSFGDITPLVIYQNNQNVITGNPLLQPSTAWNFDLGTSVFNNEVGLFTVDLFYKEISNLIFPLQNFYPFTSLSRNPYVIVAPSDVLNRLPGLNYYDTTWAKANSGYNLKAPIAMNDPSTAFLRGVEFSWQTHLWYLPGLLSGIVLDLNVSFMSSNEQYPSFKIVKTGGTAFNPINSLIYQTISGPLQNQPRAIYNAILGWDYKGFSSRFSFRYQDLTLTSMDTQFGLEDSYYGSVLLVDISLKQQIMDGLSLFANATNINNHVDSYYFSHPGYVTSTASYPAGQLPTSGQSYGWDLQLGASFNY